MSAITTIQNKLAVGEIVRGADRGYRVARAYGVCAAIRDAIKYVEEKAIRYTYKYGSYPARNWDSVGYVWVPSIREKMWERVVKPELLCIAEDQRCKLSARRNKCSGVVTFRFKKTKKEK